MTDPESTMSDARDVCTCGHVREAHEHYRRGSDCGICGRETCQGFTAEAPGAVRRGSETEEDRPNARPACRLPRGGLRGPSATAARAPGSASRPTATRPGRGRCGRR